jgi:SAM-dependent MidA family methyltransferase
LAVLPDNYTIETSPAAENWWREAAGVLARGKLLAIDYGFTADEMFSPARTRGTLRAYFRHHATDDLLANPGEQDLTAHVNFTAIQKVGEDTGLMTEFLGSQVRFLVEILAAAEKNKSLGEWSAKQTRQFQTLTHPEHLGRAFRVLVQSR